MDVLRLHRLDPHAVDDADGVEPDDDGPPPEWVRPVVAGATTPTPPPVVRPRKRGTASSMLMAAMLGLVDALGWERPKDDMVEVADAPKGADDLQLDYKHLEPLDEPL